MDYKLKLENIHLSSLVATINQDAIGFILAKIIKSSKKTRFLHLAGDENKADILRKQLDFFLPEVEILSFPAWDCLPYDRVSPKEAISASRIDSLIRLSKASDKKTLIISTINSALQKTIPLEAVKISGFRIAKGEKINIEELIK